MSNSKLSKFLDENNLSTPCLVMDLSVIDKSYKQMTNLFPKTKIYYAVKANSAPKIIDCLKNNGSYFDVSSKKEIQICLKQSVDPHNMSFGNTVKKQKDIIWAYKNGIRLFAFDSEEELKKLYKNAPRSRVFCRLQVDNHGANWPLSKKFGCSPDMAKDLMLEAKNKGLKPAGLSFHVGSQQINIERWIDALKTCHKVYLYLRKHNVKLEFLNIGGGFPVSYKDYNSDLSIFAKKLYTEIKNIFGEDHPSIIMEPGRYLVAEAGIIETEVILVSKKNKNDEIRWVYIDIGRFSGLAETENEAIKYNIIPSKNDERSKNGPVIIAGPSCDGADIIYEKNNYKLPLSLKTGDKLRILGVGAYTSVYVSNFNALKTLKEYYLDIT